MHIIVGAGPVLGVYFQGVYSFPLLASEAPVTHPSYSSRCMFDMRSLTDWRVVFCYLLIRFLVHVYLHLPDYMLYYAISL